MLDFSATSASRSSSGRQSTIEGIQYMMYLWEEVNHTAHTLYTINLTTTTPNTSAIDRIKELAQSRLGGGGSHRAEYRRIGIKESSVNCGTSRSLSSTSTYNIPGKGKPSKNYYKNMNTSDVIVWQAIIYNENTLHSK